MSQKYFGSGIPVVNGFDLGAHKPLDTRSVVATINDRDSIPAIQLYEGLTVYVEADKKSYKLVGHDENYTNLVWAEEGAGAVSITAFTLNEQDKLVEAEKVGQVIYVTTGTTEYPAGPYIVTGVGTVAKLGTTTATGDIAGDVETLKGNVATLQSDLDTAEGKIETLESDMENAKSDIDTVEGKVATLESDMETAKSDIEGLKSKDLEFQGSINGLDGRLSTAESDIDTLESKVEALASATHFLGVKESLESVTSPVAGDIVIVGNKEYVYDSEKAWVELGDTTAEAARIKDIEDTIGDSTKGLTKRIDDNANSITELSGKVATLEAVDHPTKDQVVALEGTVATIGSDITTLQAKDLELQGNINTTNTNLGNLAARVEVLEAVNHPTKDQVVALEGTVATIGSDVESLKTSSASHDTDIAELKGKVAALNVKNVDDTVSSGVSLSLEEGGNVKVNVNIDTLAAEVNAKHVVKSTDVKLGANIGTDANPDRYTTNDTVQGVLEKLNARVESIDTDVQSALSGGVTGIEEGNGITVDATTPTKPKLAVKVKEGSALNVTAEGLSINWSTF